MTQDNHFKPICTEVYGTLSDGQVVRRFTLTRDRLSVSVIEYGLYIDCITVSTGPETLEINTGLPSLSDYEADECARGSLVAPVAKISNHSDTPNPSSSRAVNDLPGNLHTDIWSGREAVDHRGPCLEFELTQTSEDSVDEVGRYIRVRLVMLNGTKCLVEYQVLSDVVCELNFAPSICLKSHVTERLDDAIEWFCDGESPLKPVRRQESSRHHAHQEMGVAPILSRVGALYSIDGWSHAVTASFAYTQPPLKVSTSSAVFFVEDSLTEDAGSYLMCVSPQPMIPADEKESLQTQELQPGSLYRGWCEFEFDAT